MILVLGVLLVAGLLTVAAFAATNGDIGLSHRDTTEKQAYYAALAGIQEYEYQMQANPDYWETCKTPNGEVPQEASERYEVTLLTVSTLPEKSSCSISKPFETMIESTGAAANTFRIESTGYAGKNKRSLIATFQVKGFLNYVYYTNYETEDPGLYSAPAGCKQKFYKARPGGCVAIKFTNGDAVNGPMHTNDAAYVCGSATFGRKGHNPADVVEINGGTYGEGCGGTPTYYTSSGKYTKGAELVPPQSDSTLGAYVEKEDEFIGVTHIVMNGAAKTLTVTNAAKEAKTIPWPKNGLIFVRTSKSAACIYNYKPENADNSEEETKETNCGNVYVSGTYSEPLTIGAEDDLIINGNISPTSVKVLGEAPSGTVTLGLIANNYVRIYHPVSAGKNGAGSLDNPWIYAAILSTNHSFVVDNFGEGEALKNLNVYGAIAQNYRGIVGTGGGGSNTGYIKDYIYDERLAVDEPPYFLSPLNSGWKVARETAPKAG